MFRIGDEASGDTIFFKSHLGIQIAVNSEKHFFIGEGWRVSPVRHFSNEGRFLGFVGAKGEGPGEFKNSISVIVGPSDSVYVFDWELGRLLVFEPEMLRYDHSINVGAPELNPSSPGELLGVTQGGYLFEYTTPFRPPGSDVGGGYDPDKTIYNPVNLVNRSGAVVKTSVAELPAGERFVRASRGSISVMPLPFGRDPFFAYNNELLYAGWNDMIEISVISEDGGVVRTIKREHESVPVTRREVEEMVSDRSRRIRRGILRSKLLSETKPAYDALVVDDHGHVWIREYPNAEAEFSKWLIIDSDSKLIGEMELPSNLLLKTIRGDRAYASVNSEMYGPHIAVYSITE